jgi:hypothetical protein
MIELARTQDEEVGDGTTSVIILGARRSGTGLQRRQLTNPSALRTPCASITRPGCPMSAATRAQ